MEKILDKIKENQNKKEKHLSKYATKSINHTRIVSEDENNDIRTSFFRDIDRILHSKAYTRYIDKTQVFIDQENDHITHRIIHVALVSKIAKTIGRALNLNEDLIEAIAIGHDIGHTPFGHVGEAFLNEISLKETNTFFAHNIQSVRTLMTLENNGLNLCIETLDGIMCHNGEILDNIYSPQIKTKEIFLNEYNMAYTDINVLKKLRPMTLEGCVVRISDIIGYIGRDIEDAIKLGKLSRDDLPKELTNILGNNNKDIVNTLILDIIKNSYNKPYIKMSKDVFKALKALKSFNYEYIYDKAHTKEQKDEYKNIINRLFYYYKEQLTNNNKEIVNELTHNNVLSNDINRTVIDYIAGSTDKYLILQYKKHIDTEL